MGQSSFLGRLSLEKQKDSLDIRESLGDSYYMDNMQECI